MSWFDEFKTRMNMNGKSLSEELMNNTQYLLDETFMNSPTFKFIKHNQVDVPSRVVNASSKNGWSKYNNDYRKIIFQNLKYVCGIGDYVQFDGHDWIAIDRENINGSSVTVELCNNVLTISPTVKIPILLSNKVLYSDGTKIEQYGTLPDGKVNVVVGKTPETSNIQMGQRFIFDNSKYKIFSVSLIDDFTMPGIVVITMIQEQHREGKDDLVNNIADNSDLNEEGDELWQV